MRSELIARSPDGFAPLVDRESLAKSLQSPLIAQLRDGVLVRVETRDPERLLAGPGDLPAHADHILGAVGIVREAVDRGRLELQPEQPALGHRYDRCRDDPDSDI